MTPAGRLPSQFAARLFTGALVAQSSPRVSYLGSANGRGKLSPGRLIHETLILVKAFCVARTLPVAGSSETPASPLARHRDRSPTRYSLLGQWRGLPLTRPQKGWSTVRRCRSLTPTKLIRGRSPATACRLRTAPGLDMHDQLPWTAGEKTAEAIKDAQADHPQIVVGHARQSTR